jgi:hypothetical protein
LITSIFQVLNLVSLAGWAQLGQLFACLAGFSVLAQKTVWSRICQFLRKGTHSICFATTHLKTHLAA